MRSFLLLLLFSFLAYGQEHSIISERVPEHHIAVHSHVQEDADNLAQAAECFAREIDRVLFFSGRPRRLLNISLLEENPPPKPNPLYLHCPPGTASLEICYELAQRLIQRRIQESTYEKLPSLSSTPWLAAGICNRIFFDGKGLRTFYAPDFRVLREQFQQGHFPDVRILLTCPVPPSSPALFRLYLIQCDLFVKVLENRKDARAIFPRLFELEQENRTSPEALEILLRDSWQPGDTLQAWFEKAMMEESQRGWLTNEADDTLAELENLLNISVVEAGNRNAVKRIPLEKIPERLVDYKLNTVAITQMQQKNARLIRRAPLLLKAPLNQFNIALETLKNGQKYRFRWQFSSARKELNAAIARQKRIAQLLETTENSQRPLLEPFEPYLDIVEKYDQMKYK